MRSDFKEVLIEAISSLTINKLRTGLAMLGIVIGIGSVIALVSIGQASQEAVKSQIQAIGSNLLTISPGSQRNGMVRGAMGGGTTLTYEDAQAIAAADSVTSVALVAPTYSSRSQIVAASNNTNTQVMGVTAAYATVSNLTMSSGSFITDSQLEAQSKVAVLGPTVVEDLFGAGANPVGQTIRIEGKNFLIIGVTASKGGNSMQSQDDMIFVPLTTAQKQLYGVKYLSSILLQVKSQEEMILAQNQVGYLLLARHKMSDPASADFTLRSQEDILQAATSVSGTLTALLTGVAAISLLVGGIGIMNIMLVTVTERTREIGLRKALGAKRRIIIQQFLIESVLLTFVGGILGVALGVLVSYLYSLYAASLFMISTYAVLLGFGVSAVIGVIFGLYPAQRAANLQPIEALRYE